VNLAELPGAAVDRAQGRDRRGDGRRSQPVSGQPVYKPLELRQRDLAQALAA
jgi:hypothetical protein